MKNIQLALVMGLLLSLSAIPAQASNLTAIGSGLVYDSVSNITWTADGNLLGTLEAGNPSLVSTIISDIVSVTDSTGVHTLTAADFGSNGSVDWWGAEAYVAYLNYTNYDGYSDWRLPTTILANYGYNQTGSEMGNLFYNNLGVTAFNSITSSTSPDYALFSNVQSSAYWSGAASASHPYVARLFDTNDGNEADNFKISQLYAWAVRPGDVAAVPELSIIWLLGSALLGLLCFKPRGNIG